MLLKQVNKLLYNVLLCVALCSSVTVDAARIKDIAAVEGQRGNFMIGYGIVAGLNGSGDNFTNATFTQTSLIDFLNKMGVTLSGSTLKTKNVAAVIVTANVSAFASAGTEVDVRVSALGDATSLRSGILIATPLRGPDGNVYAIAQGPVSVPSFEPASNAVKTTTTKIETTGYIDKGAIVESEIAFDFSELSTIKFSLYNPDFKTALDMADAINDAIPGNTAVAKDPATVEVVIPKYRKDNVVHFISEIESLTISPDYKAKIIISEATGTIVIGDNVTVRKVAISQGNLIINIDAADVVQTSASATTQQRMNEVLDKRRGTQFAEVQGASLTELVSGLNKLGVWTKDIINILQSMKAVGAIDATIEVR